MFVVGGGRPGQGHQAARLHLCLAKRKPNFSHMHTFKNERTVSLILSGSAALGSAFLVGYLYDWYLRRNGSLTEETQALTAELSGKTSVRRVPTASLDSATSTLTDGFIVNSLVKELSDPSFSPGGFSAASKRMCRVLLSGVLPSSQGAVVLGSPNESALAIWIPSGEYDCNS